MNSTSSRERLSSAIALKNTSPLKQKASVLHSSYCNAIVRLRSCKATNVVKKTKASPCGDAFVFLANDSNFDTKLTENKDDNRHLPYYQYLPLW